MNIKIDIRGCVVVAAFALLGGCADGGIAGLSNSDQTDKPM